MRLSLEEWIEKYEKKTGDKHELPQGYVQYYLPERGYAQYIMDREVEALYVYELCGDAKFWYDLGALLCRQNGLRFITTVCTRHIKPYIRFWGWTIHETIEGPDGGAIRMNGRNKDGGFVTIATAWRNDDTGEYAYYCTSEVVWDDGNRI